MAVGATTIPQPRPPVACGGLRHAGEAPADHLLRRADPVRRHAARSGSRQHKGSPRLRISTSAGEALPEHIGKAWKARFGTDIVDGVGSTEMLHIFLSNHPDDIVYGTSGRAVPGYEMHLRDENGEKGADGGGRRTLCSRSDR